MTTLLSDKAQNALSKFPGPVFLQPSPLLFTACMILGGVFFLMIGVTGWYVGSLPHAPIFLVFFKYPLTLLTAGYWLAALWLLIDLARGKIWLRLDEVGFQASLWVRRAPEHWNQISDISVHTLNFLNKLVTYQTTRPPSAWNLNRLILGGKKQLPPKGVHCGLRTSDLANLMNAWRQRALAKSHDARV